MTEHRSGLRLWLLAFFGFWLLHAAWAFGTPIDGPPDELQHIIRAAGVARGELVAGADQLGGFQHVPAGLDRGWCFPTKVNVAADCEPEPDGDRTIVSVHSTAARYNPVYYLVTGWPIALWPTWPGIILARLLTGALMAGLLAGAVVAAARWFRHRGIVAGVAVGLTPMIAHMGGAVNPSGVEIAAGTALFAALLALLHERAGGVSRAMVALAGLSAAVLVTPRFTGVMWLAVIAGVLLVPSRKARLAELVRSRTVWVWAAVVFVAVASSAAWTLIGRTVEPVAIDRGLRMTEIVRFAVFDMWPNVANQMIGVTGWAETLMPRLVYVVWFMAGGLLLLGGLLLGTRTDRWRMLALFFATFAPLLVVEILIVNSVGFFNQGRYFLPGAVGLPMLGAWAMARGGLSAEQQRSVTRLLVLLLLPIQLVCLAYSIARWSSGLASLNPFNGSWHPPYGAALPLIMGVLAVAVLFVTYWRASAAPRPLPVDPPPDEDITDAVIDEPVSADEPDSADEPIKAGHA